VKASESERAPRVLIIDDNLEIHGDFKRVLTAEEGAETLDAAASALFAEERTAAQTAQYRLDFRSQGQEGALLVREAAYERDPFAVAFVDMRMPPGWDGLETIERIWEEDPDVQIVICTAYSDHSWSEIVEKLGQTDRLLVLKKPYEVIEVQQTTAALVHKWQTARKLAHHVENLAGIVEAKTNAYREKNEQLASALSDLQRTQSQLVHAEKMSAIGRLAEGMAHEINTPAQYVLDNMAFLQEGFTSINKVLVEHMRLFLVAKEAGVFGELVKGLEAEYGTQDLEFLKHEIPSAIAQSVQGMERVAQLVQSMKQFAQPGRENGGEEDLNEAIRTTVNVARLHWEPAAEVECELAADLPRVWCRGSEIRQVLLSLLVNAAQAIKGMGAGVKGRIRIASRRVGSDVEIRISDSGPGVPPELRSKIFEPLFTTREVGSGTGQGLATAYQIMTQRHQGSLALEESDAAGATFVLRLPLVPAPRAAAG
jgi:two-component system, NtrC family, sensor kinase